MTALAADQINPARVTHVEQMTADAPRPQNAIRRFEIADLSRHGGWILKRLTQQYPHIPERSLGAFLYQMVSNNEFSFLCSEHAVGLAALVKGNALTAVPLIQEQFCWAEDPSNKSHVAAAADFYGEWRTWASNMSLDVLVVMENSDVPSDQIEKQLGPLRKKPQVFARVRA